MKDEEKIALAIAAAGIAGVGIYALSKSAKAKPQQAAPQMYATLTVTVKGQGTVEIEDNGTQVGIADSATGPVSVNIPVGDTVTLIATPAAGWEFAGFST